MTLFAGRWGLMLMTYGFYSIPISRGFFVPHLYRTYLVETFVPSIVLGNYESWTVRWAGVLAASHCMYGLCGKRWKRPSVVILDPFLLQQILAFASSRDPYIYFFSPFDS